MERTCILRTLNIDKIITFGLSMFFKPFLNSYLSVVFVLLPVIFSYLFIINNPDVMANNGLLFVSNAAKAQYFCSKVSNLVKRVLYIKFNNGPESLLPIVNREINHVYSRANQCGDLDVRLMLKPMESIKKIKTSYPIDIIMYDRALAEETHILKQSVENIKENYQFQTVVDSAATNAYVSDFEDTVCLKDIMEPVKTYEYVALGGTFDRLHNGHKMLLSHAALRATKHLTVGVTDVNMIQSKTLWELIEPIDKRIKAVHEFLIDINPDLEYDIVPLQDLYGPTKDDPRFQLIVVSEETMRGAEKINEKRKEKRLPLLDVHVIGLAQDLQKQFAEEEAKVSSSNQRMRLLGTFLKPPMPNPNIPDWPYIIGLAGGIASGKSNIAEKLRLKGAAIVNCDIIAHELYKPGLPLNNTLAHEFGNDIITETGEVDRRKLGQIVFSDKGQLEKLNQIVWPAVIEEAMKRIQALGNEGYRVVVMEAAVMVRAKWYNYCHQLWSVIIPPNEAIKRLQIRNNLSEEEARQRVESQPPNSEQVAMANVVFSPYWSYEYTAGQIDRAWEHLTEYLQSRK